jgi:hypothetical protein
MKEGRNADPQTDLFAPLRLCVSFIGGAAGRGMEWFTQRAQRGEVAQ